MAQSGSAHSAQGPERTTEKQTAFVPVWSLLLPVLAAAFLLLISSQLPDGKLHVWVLDVGQGDSILIKTPKGHVAVVDGGPGATPLLNGIGRHVPFWQHNLDMVVLTHPHADHMTGLVELLSHYGVAQVVQTEFTGTLGVQGAWLQALKERAVPVYYPSRDDVISFEGEPDISLRVLSPATPSAARERAGGDINNTSIVMRLSYGAESILLEGDAQLEAESEMLQTESDNLRADVLKVGHHGSSTSTSAAFLSKVSPEVAVISVGQPNPFGHPAQSTLDALQKEGAALYRTDGRGTVEIIADKTRLWVQTDR